MRKKMNWTICAMFAFVLLSSCATAKKETLATPFVLLPAMNAESGPSWIDRFIVEMPKVAAPYVGVNVVDVKPENYEALRDNIARQVQAGIDTFGSEMLVYSVAKFDEIWRVVWLLQHNVIIPQDQLTPEQTAGFGAIWAEYTDLAEGYQWHITPAPTVAGSVFEKDSGRSHFATEQETLATPFVPLPAMNAETGPSWLDRFIVEMPKAAAPYVGVNFVDVKPENYEALRVNMAMQSQSSIDTFGSELLVYSVAKLDEIWRVTWLLQHNVVIPRDQLTAEQTAAVGALWAEFTDLAEGYQWHLSPAPTVAGSVFEKDSGRAFFKD